MKPPRSISPPRPNNLPNNLAAFLLGSFSGFINNHWCEVAVERAFDPSAADVSFLFVSSVALEDLPILILDSVTLRGGVLATCVLPRTASLATMDFNHH